jgi:hypothetical protein
MRVLKRRKRRPNGPRARRYFPDVFSDPFGDEYELGDDVDDSCLGGQDDTQK